MRKSVKKKQQKRSFWHLVPGMLLFGIWPCIVHMHMTATNLESYAWFPNVVAQGEFFLFDRGKVLLFLSVWMLLILIDRILLSRSFKIPWKRFILLGVFSVMAVLSTVFSKHKVIATEGIMGSYETIFILLSYFIVLVYLTCVVKDKKDLQLLLYALTGGIVIQVMIGITQIVGRDFWSTVLGKWLITLGVENAGTLEFNFAVKGENKIYLSFYNPNYAGVYAVLMLPILTTVIWKWKKYWKAIGICLETGLFVCMIASGSRAAMITIVFLIVLTAVWYIWQKKKKRLIIGVTTGVILCGVMFYISPLYQYVLRGIGSNKTVDRLEAIELSEDRVKIRYKGKELYADAFLISENELLIDVRGKKGKALPVIQNEDGSYSVNKKPFKKLKFDAYVEGETMNLVFYQKKVPWIFSKPLSGGTYTYKTIYGKNDTIEQAESFGFKGKERWLSDRGYIFSRTFPMLKDYLLLGSGPDTYAVVFPQNDYIAKANVGLRMYSEILTRPHNFYLQTWVQTGLVSLLALLGFIGIYFGKNRSIWKKSAAESGDTVIWYRRGIFLAVVGYLIMGLLNDSMIVTAPLFWGILGIGIALEE